MYTEHLHIPVGAGVLHVERTGRGGPPVVLLHGFGTCAFLWRSVAPVLADDGFTVIAVDLLGFGESERRPGVAYGPSAQARYVERALTSLRLGEVRVVGQDVGGLIGLLLAAEHPRRVQRLALLAPPDPADLPGPAIRALQRTSATAALGANALFGARPLLEPLLTRGVTDPARMPDALIARYLAPFVGGEGMGELLQLASAVTISDEELRAIAELTTPVLLWPGGDISPKPAAASDGVRWLPMAQVTSVDVEHTGGTLVAEDAPEALIAALRSWLA